MVLLNKMTKKIKGPKLYSFPDLHFSTVYRSAYCVQSLCLYHKLDVLKSKFVLCMNSFIYIFSRLNPRCGITVFSGCSVAVANASPQAEFTSSKDSEFQRHITSLPLYPDSYFLQLLLTIANTVALIMSHRAEGATRGLASKTLLQSLTFPDTTDYFSQCLVFLRITLYITL